MKRSLPPAVGLLLLQTAALAAGPQTFETQPHWMRPGTIYGSFGYVVAGVGDTNADGFDDVVVTGPFYGTSGPSVSQQGAVIVYRGSATGLPPEAPAIIGTTPSATMGLIAAAAGDVNGDGYDDIVFESDTTSRVHVRFGPALDPAAGWNFDSGQSGDSDDFGPVVDGGGDINGDGYDDILAGFSTSDSQRGRLRVFHGSVAGLSTQPNRSLVGAAGERFAADVTFAGDVDADGFDDVLTCSNTTQAAGQLKLFRGTDGGIATTPSWTYQTVDVACDGWKMLNAGGDLNGDGYDDVVARAPLANHEGGQGKILIFFGSSSGLARQPSQVVYGDGWFGFGAAGVGDVNRDGFDDLAVGAPELGAGGTVMLLLGSEIGVQPVPAWVNEGPADATRIGWSVASAGDVDADGFDDLIAGDPSINGTANLFRGIALGGPGPAGSFGVEGSEQLTLRRDAAGRPALDWGSACGAGSDYAIYAGTIGDFSSHAPVTCSTGGLRTWTLPADSTSRYFLIVPRSQDREGSYGRDSGGGERPASLNACEPQEIASCN